MYKIGNANFSKFHFLLRKTPNIFLSRNFPINKLFSTKNENEENKNSDEEVDKPESERQRIIRKIVNLTYPSLKQKFDLIGEDIEDNTYKVETTPDPNCFGEAVLFYAPHSVLLHGVRRKIEFSAVPFFTGVTFLSSFGLAFPSYFLPYYFVLISTVTYIRYFLHDRFTKIRAIYQMNLLNEHQVRIIYEDGESETVEIKNISLSPKIDQYFKMFAENKPEMQNRLRMANNNLHLLVQTNKEKEGLMIFKFQYNDISYAELDLLLGILNKKTHRLSLE